MLPPCAAVGLPGLWRLCGPAAAPGGRSAGGGQRGRAVSMRVQGLLWLHKAARAVPGGLCCRGTRRPTCPCLHPTSKAFPNLWPARHPTAAGRRRRRCLCRCAAWSATFGRWPLTVAQRRRERWRRHGGTALFCACVAHAAQTQIMMATCVTLRGVPHVRSMFSVLRRILCMKQSNSACSVARAGMANTCAQAE